MNASVTVSLGYERISRLYPEYLHVDSSLVILSMGPSLRRQVPNLEPGRRLSEHLALSDDIDAARLMALGQSGEAVQLHATSGTCHLCGSVLHCSDGTFLLAMRNALQDYIGAGQDFHISDFGPDDPIVQGIMLLGLQQAMLEEARANALELARQRQQGEEMLQRLKRVSGLIAHDFNNILSAIELNCRRLANVDRGSTRYRQMAELVFSTVRRGSEITRTLSALGNQNGEGRQLLTIDALIDENLSLMNAIAGPRVQVRLLASTGRVLSEVSRSGLVNCLFELAANARDAMPDGGTLTIRTTRVAGAARRHPATMAGRCRDYVMIELADTGPGVPAEVLARAFEPLFTTKQRAKGIGLLAVRDFAREMGGDAFLDSDHGNGTTATIYLPVAAAGAETVACRRPPALAARAAGGADIGKRVLVVDDEAHALEALEELLADAGLKVTACLSADEACKALGAEPFDILLTDVVMPGCSGLELAARAEDMQPAIRAILMSGFVPDCSRLRPHWAFIPKPLDMEFLLGQLLDGPALPSAPSRTPLQSGVASLPPVVVGLAST